MKFAVVIDLSGYWRVAPHAGAWIEIISEGVKNGLSAVVPHAGAWIEITTSCDCASIIPLVAPHAGAWIEIRENMLKKRVGKDRSLPTRERGLKYLVLFLRRCDRGRSPRGSVD